MECVHSQGYNVRSYIPIYVIKRKRKEKVGSILVYFREVVPETDPVEVGPVAHGPNAQFQDLGKRSISARQFVAALDLIYEPW